MKEAEEAHATQQEKNEKHPWLERRIKKVMDKKEAMARRVDHQQQFWPSSHQQQCWPIPSLPFFQQHFNFWNPPPPPQHWNHQVPPPQHWNHQAPPPQYWNNHGGPSSSQQWNHQVPPSAYQQQGGQWNLNIMDHQQNN